MNLNFRGIDPKTAAKIHSYRVEHGLNLNEALEEIIKEWVLYQKVILSGQTEERK